jgi:hypothetical protein
LTTEFPPPAANKAELIERVMQQRLSLDALVAPLSAAEMLQPLGGWSVRDHIAHLNVWAGKALAVLQNRPPHDGLGLEWPPADPRDVDTLNAFFHERTRDVPLEDVLEESGRLHTEVLTALMLASERLLHRPMPPDEPDGRTVLAVVAANTYEHSIEHETWIREGLAGLRSR